jgi:uncharacterized protein (DUF488 family)
MFDLLSIGHSNIPADRFIAMLRQNGAEAVADVRSTPASRFFPWFSAINLAARLSAEQMLYLPYGAALGGRPRDAALYRDGVADYEAMARQPQYRAALDTLTADAAHRRVCVMCAEREPLDCHRCLLVAPAVAARGFHIGHILADGTIEPHDHTEDRLLAMAGGPPDLFADRAGRIAAAYARRAGSAAFRRKEVAG